ncbi:MAG: hypothetical protein KatS3mg105_2909 [Gemmatales bacterium]|nr:MAG: hypothetical protein KatS3mg105_2909 [Gemmatales bacterium]
MRMLDNEGENPKAIAPIAPTPPASLSAPPAARGLPTFRSLRHRNYRLFFFGQVVSLQGVWIQQTGLIWLAHELTGQSKWPALISAVQIFPTCFLGIWGGALADRFPKRSLIFCTQCGLMALSLLLAAFVLAGPVDPYLLLVISLGVGLIQAVDVPARLSFVVDLVGRDDVMNAVALNSLSFNVARGVGPAIAGWILVFFGAGYCFLLNGLSYLAVLWALIRMDLQVAAPPQPGGRTWRDIFFRRTLCCGASAIRAGAFACWSCCVLWLALSFFDAGLRHGIPGSS